MHSNATERWRGLRDDLIDGVSILGPGKDERGPAVQNDSTAVQRGYSFLSHLDARKPQLPVPVGSTHHQTLHLCCIDKERSGKALTDRTPETKTENNEDLLFLHSAVQIALHKKMLCIETVMSSKLPITVQCLSLLCICLLKVGTVFKHRLSQQSWSLEMQQTFTFVQ